MKRDIRITLCQMNVRDNKHDNIEKALRMLDSAAHDGADIAVLPEMFNCPYNNSKFRDYAENENSSITLEALSEKAKALGMYVAGGSIPEEDNGQIFNTAYFLGKEGEILGKHRKMHLFDIDVKDRIRFIESEVLTAGEDITVIDTELAGIGLAVCYDIRFPELSRLLALKGAEIIIVPGAFNMVTGPAHWELLIRTRALDNQVYVAGVSPARDKDASYVAYGNSMLANPWGEILLRLDDKEDITTGTISKDAIAEVRTGLPLLAHRRTDIYSIKLLDI